MAQAWFKSTLYFQNKLASLGEGWDANRLIKAFKDAGFDPNNEDSMQAHFDAYGKFENVSPNALFDAETYYYNKALQYFKTNNATAGQVEYMKTMFDGAGLSAWDHYTQYGVEEGINPSTAINTNQYMADKLAQMRVGDPSYTMDQLLQAFKDAGLNPISHYYVAGQGEGMILKPSVSGKVISLSTADDLAIGGAGDDYFFAKLGQLNDGDEIYGGAGYDTLEAYVDGSNAATQPTVMHVEKLIFRAQQETSPSGSNVPYKNGIPINIDATNIEGMTYLQNDNSRASFGIEDIRTNSNEMTIAWSNSDAGKGMNFGVYFDNQHLKSADAKTSGVISLEIMDVKNATVSSTNPTAFPLKDNYYNKFTFEYTDNSGKKSLVTLELSNEDRALWTGESANYDTLLQAFKNALAASDWADVFVIKPGTTYDASSKIGGTTWTPSILGTHIDISTDKGSIASKSELGATGWGSESGTVPPDSAISTNVVVEGSQDCPLIQTTIHLDNVGRVQWGDASPDCLPNNEIYGSEAGNMVVGGMTNRGGVERFDVYVDQGSWLSSLASTNEALRLVKVHKTIDINGDGIYGNVKAHANQADGTKGALFIGKQLDNDPHYGYMVDYNAKGPGSSDGTTYADKGIDNITQWTDRAFLLGRDGLVDVKEFDAKDYDGNINLGASLTATSLYKYLRDVDGSWNNGINGKFAPNGDFKYDFTNQGDILNMSIDGGLAADNDFKLVINANGGDDFVNFSFNNATGHDSSGVYHYTAPTDDQIKNSNALRNVIINGGEGKDTVKVWGNTAVTVNGDAGNDVIFVSQVSDVQDKVSTTEQNAVFIFNAAAADRGILSTNQGAQSLYNDILSTVDTVNYTGGAPAATTMYISVSFKGIASARVAVSVKADTTTNTNGTINADDLNMAIIKAINNDPVLSKLLVAKDGAGHSLLVESLIDGVMTSGDLGISYWEAATGTDTFAVTGDAYNTQLATDGHHDNTLTLIAGMGTGAVGGAGGNPLVITATATTNTDLTTGINNGDILYITINGETYYVKAAGALADDAAFAALLNSAVSSAGHKLSDSYKVADDGGGATNGIITITSNSNIAGTATLPSDFGIGKATNTGATLVEGTNDGTHSLNHVWGGAGDDIIVLNAGSNNAWYDVVEFKGTTAMSEGHDIIYNFTLGADKIDFSAYGTKHVVVTGAVMVGDLTIAEAVTALVGTYNAANDKGGALIQDATNANKYWVVKADAGADGTLSDAEVVILGTVTFDNTTGVLATGDLV